MATASTKRDELARADAELADFLASCYDDPLRYVMAAFPWTVDKSLQMVKLPLSWRHKFDSEYGPDEWACRFLDDLGKQIRQRKFDGKRAVDPIRFSTVSGHGIGKTTLVAWLIKFILDTRPLSRGTVTATTADQLKTKTWAEVAKWHKLSFTQHWFKYSNSRGSMNLTHYDHPEQWRCDAITCKDENKEAFQGQHAVNSTSFYIFDEASGVPDAIFDAREGGLTDGEPMIFDFGNGTRNRGWFFEDCEGSNKHRYTVRSIDSRDVQITNKKFFKQMVDDYGEDSDRVKIKCRGMFPTQSSKQFMNRDAVMNAMHRILESDRKAPLVLGVDVARRGLNDSVIYPRQGNDARSWRPERFSGADSVQLLGHVVETVRRFERLGTKVAAIFVDGGGVGGPLYDHLKRLGYPAFEVQFWGSPLDAQTYHRKVDELWGRLKEEIGRNLCLPSPGDESADLISQALTKREFDYTTKDQVSLEAKEDIEGIDSAALDITDALALTFAQHVATVDEAAFSQTPTVTDYDYDPLAADAEREPIAMTNAN